MRYAEVVLSSIIDAYGHVYGEIEFRDAWFWRKTVSTRRLGMRPWVMPGRKDYLREEVILWLKLVGCEMAEAHFVEEMTRLMEAYYGLTYPRGLVATSCEENECNEKEHEYAGS